MYDYVVGTILFSLFTLSLYILGTAVLTDEKNSAYRFIIGYLVYSFFVAVGGIIIYETSMVGIFYFYGDTNNIFRCFFSLSNKKI